MTSARLVLGQPDATSVYRDTFALYVVLRNSSGQICLVSTPSRPLFSVPNYPSDNDLNDTLSLEGYIHRELGYECSVQRDAIASTEEWREDDHKICSCYTAMIASDALVIANGVHVEWLSLENAIQKLNNYQSDDVIDAHDIARSLHFLTRVLQGRESGPLAPLDPNTRSSLPVTVLGQSNDTVKPIPSFAQESQQHRYLHSKVLAQERSGQQRGTYVSPSDEIMSPASAKLNAVKERRFAKSAKPRMLFANMRQSNVENN